MNSLTRAAIRLALAACVLHPLNAGAQAYPNRPIRMVTQFAAGSGGDVAIRIVSSAMSDVMGQPVVVDNRAGAGGVIAAEAVARTAPDGYTILAATPNTHVARVFLARSSSFDPVKDFTPITAVGETYTCIVVNPSVPFKTFKEMIEYAKRNPGKLSYGTSGIGSTHHLSGEQIKMFTGAELVHVPYKAGAQAMLDLIAGQIPVSYSISGPVLPVLASGKIKVLAVVNDRRYRLLPDVPTVTEVIPGFEPPPGWTGLFGPAALPQAVLRRLHADIVKAITAPEARARLGEAGFEVIADTPEEFAALIKHQIELVGKIVKAAGIQPTD